MSDLPDGWTVDSTPAELPAGFTPDATDAPKTSLGRALRYADNIVRQVANGATFGFADEIAAGADTALARSPTLSDLITGKPITYEQRVQKERERDRAFHESDPAAATIAEFAGALAGPGKFLMANRAISALPTLALRGAASGATAGAVGGFGGGEGGFENRLGSAGRGAAVGGTIGGVLPGALLAARRALPMIADAGTGAGTVVNTLLGRYDADQRALDRIAAKIDESGKTPNEIASMVRPRDMGASAEKPVSLLDVGGDQVQRLGQTVSDLPGPGSSQVRTFLEGRDLGTGANPLMREGGAADRIAKDLETIFGDKLFHSTDDALVAAQKAAAQPLYEKALKGGSIAPLEKQFEKSFGEAVSAERAAQGEVQNAQRTLLLNKAEGSQTSDVYSGAGITAEGREAQSALEAAQAKLAAAQEAKDAILGRLRQAQSDASSSAPGAVWSPRIQEFMDDPIMRQGLKEGVEVQRLESLAEGKKFDPRELAITGFSDAGDPIVAAVPNMRTLDTAKRGLDKILEGYRDSTTGRLMLDQRGRAIDQVRRAYVKELDTLNSEYKPARDAWAGPAQSRDALRAGRSAINADEADVTRRFSGLDPSEQEMFKIGFKKALFDKVKATPDGADELKRIVGTPAMRERMGAILSPDEYGDLMGRLGTEATMFKTKGDILGNSNTAPRLANMAETVAADAMASVAKKGPLGAAADFAIRKLVEAGGMTKRVAESSARFLTETDPDKLAEIIQQLQGRAQPKPSTSRALMTYGLSRQQALSAALAMYQSAGR